MKKTGNITAFVFVAMIAIALVVPLASSGAEAYKLASPIPNVGSPDSTTDVFTFEEYVGIAYKASIALAAFFAVFFIAYAAIQYIVSRGDTSKITEAKDKILNAIYGLLLLIGAVLILNTINRDIVETQIVNVGGGSSILSDADRIQAQARWTALRQTISAQFSIITPINTVDSFEDMAVVIKSWAEDSRSLGGGATIRGPLAELEKNISDDQLRNFIVSNKIGARNQIVSTINSLVLEGRNMDQENQSLIQRWGQLNSSSGGDLNEAQLDSILLSELEALEKMETETTILAEKAVAFRDKARLSNTNQGAIAENILATAETGKTLDDEVEASETSCRSKWGEAYLSIVRQRISTANLIGHIQSRRSAVAAIAYYNYYDSIYNSLPRNFSDSDLSLPNTNSLKGAPDYRDRIYETWVNSINGGELYIADTLEFGQIIDAYDSTKFSSCRI
jgi:hypothetical protein